MSSPRPRTPAPRRAPACETAGGGAASRRGAAARGSGPGLLSPLRDLDEGGERLWVAHGNVGQHLAIEANAGDAEAVDEAAVAYAAGAGGSVDALDPELSEVALTRPSIAVGVAPRV